VFVKPCSRIVSVALILLAFAFAQLPANGQEKNDRAKPTPESIAKGKKIYKIDCAMCHGENGDGKNDMDMKNVPDLTSPDVQAKGSDAAWFDIVKKGKGDMPPEEPRAKSDDDIWNLVNYCRSLAKK